MRFAGGIVSTKPLKPIPRGRAGGVAHELLDDVDEGFLLVVIQAEHLRDGDGHGRGPSQKK